MIKFYDEFLFEQHGSNKLVVKLTDYIIKIINNNIGKLILNNQLTLKSELNNFKEIKFENDIINLKLSNRFYGNMNPTTIKIENNIINGLVMNIEFVLSDPEKFAKQIFNNSALSNTISHELLHIIELYLTEQQKNAKAKSWNYGEKLQNMQDKYKDKNWIDISYFIYLSLPHEMRARIEQLNTDIRNKNIKGIKSTIDYIKTTKIYKDVEFISNLDLNIVFKKMKKDINYLNIIKDFNLLFLENDVKEIDRQEKEFLKYFESIKLKNKKLLQKLLKVSYNFENFSYFEFPDIEINYEDYL